jgi:hypothetical protein
VTVVNAAFAGAARAVYDRFFGASKRDDNLQTSSVAKGAGDSEVVDPDAPGTATP